MAVRKVNVLRCDLDETLDEAGFRHAVAPLAHRLGAQRIGAAVYEAVADRAIWPYHYHYSTEEWLYVVAGTPVLREPFGRRALQRGDLVCFPADHRGAHTVLGPGRFIIFATNESSGPWVSVYPDSDKISVAPGLREPSALNSLRLPRAGAVDYWHGEGNANPPAPAFIEREPAETAALPVANVFTTSLGNENASMAPRPPRRMVTLGPDLGAASLSATVVELDPGAESEPYHYVHGRETWVLILSGSATLRHPTGEDLLHENDIAAFPEGPGGAHCVVNHSGEALRAVFLSTTAVPANICYPDTGSWVIRNGPDDAEITLHEADSR
jgi:uncharacterized cupin superfamily protein